ncbi:Myb-like dna-binding protein [Globisporangium polare]
MTISTRVKAQLFATTPTNREQLIRLPPTSAKQGGVVVARYIPSMASSLSPSVAHKVIKTWTKQEHDLFLQGLELFPHGPWKKIADFIGSKTARQTMAHAQKYRQKIARRQLIWKTAALSAQQQHNSSCNSSPAMTPQDQQVHHQHQLLMQQHSFMGMFRSPSHHGDFGAMGMLSSSCSASSTPDTSDDEGGSWSPDFQHAGRPHLGSDGSDYGYGPQETQPPSQQLCPQGHVCADATHCDNCFFEQEILPMLVQLDTTGLSE